MATETLSSCVTRHPILHWWDMGQALPLLPSTTSPLPSPEHSVKQPTKLHLIINITMAQQRNIDNDNIAIRVGHEIVVLWTVDLIVLWTARLRQKWHDNGINRNDNNGGTS